MTGSETPAVLGDDAGVSVIEFSLILPFMLAFAFGTLEYVNYVNTHAQISHAALTMADTASRTFATSGLAGTDMSEQAINDAFEAVRLDTPGLDLMNGGRMVLSSLEVDASGRQIVRWQRCRGALTAGVPDYGKQNAVLSGGMGPAANRVTAPSNGAVMFVQIAYRYKPIIFGNWLSDAASLLNYTAAYQVRDRRALGKLPVNPSSATVSTC